MMAAYALSIDACGGGPTSIHDCLRMTVGQHSEQIAAGATHMRIHHGQDHTCRQCGVDCVSSSVE
jgi:hypothetical protein